MLTHARLSRLLVSFLAGLLLVGAAVATPAAARGGYRPSYEETGCDTPLFEGRIPDGLDAECGLLTVKENRLKRFSTGNKVVMPVVIIKATGANPKADPVLMLAGGPGGSGIDIYLNAGQGLHDHTGKMLVDRDVILMDTRGTGRATPSLFCYDPEMGIERDLAAMYRMFGATDDVVTERAVLDQAYIDCAADLRAAGVDLDQYDTPTVVRDIKDLRKALGIKKWNVYGRSAGAAVALELLRQQPWGLRSVVLDSPYPTYAKQDPATQARNYREAFDAIIELLELDQDLVEASLAAIRDKYDEKPFATEDPYFGLPIEYTGSDAVWMLSQLMYLPDLVPLLEELIANLEYYDTGEPEYVSVMEYLGYETVFDFTRHVFFPLWNDWSDGARIVVECADRTQYLETADYAAVVEAEPIYGLSLFDRPTLPNVCEQIDVDPVPLRTYIIRRTLVPSLVLAGSLDSSTPPGDSKVVSEKLGPRSQFVEFPRAAHVVADYSDFDPAADCADEMIADFVSNPRQPVDTGCICG